MNFALFLEMHACGRPEALAVADSRLRLSYAELERAASGFAAHLKARGIGEGERVAFFLPNRVELAIGLLGAFKAGVIAVPLNWRLVEADLAQVLRHCEPRLLVASEELAQNLPLPDGTALLLAGKAPRSGSFWEALTADRFPAVGRQARDIANLLYTSGTTARPKAAIHTHGMRFTISGTMADCFGLSCRDVGLAVSPLFHTGGLSVFCNAIFAGGAVHLLERWDLGDFLAAIEREQVTFLHLVSTIVVDLVRAPADRFAALPKTVRFCWGGGHNVDPNIFLEYERRIGGLFLQGYSRTEGGIAYNPLDRDRRRFDRHGFPSRNNSEMAILDPATEQPQPADTTGEIVFRGDGVTPGYWDRAGLIAPPAFSGGWQRTGDLGQIGADGSLLFIGREDHVIKTGGENVSPAEVGAVLLGLPGVSDAVVLDLPDERLGKVVAALVVPKDPSLTVAEIDAGCRAALAGFKIPRRIAIVAELPRLGSQKVDLAACREILRRHPGPLAGR